MSKRSASIERLAQARLLYLAAEHGLTDSEVARYFKVHPTTATRMRLRLACSEIVAARYGLEPTDEDIALARAILARAERFKR